MARRALTDCADVSLQRDALQVVVLVRGRILGVRGTVAGGALQATVPRSAVASMLA
jgi:hypothetical protein